MKVRAWDDMEKEFGLDEGGDIKCRCWFTKQMRPTCGKTMRIESVFEELKIYLLAGDITHRFTDEMLEAVADDFKVGDRVRVIGNIRHSAEIGATGVICCELKDGIYDYGVCFDKANPIFHNCNGECEKRHGQYVMADEIEKIAPFTEKIVITSDGKTTLARLYENGEVTKTAEAKCSPSDKFDFAVGAKLAFERLNEKTEPKKLFNGKAVCIEKDDDYCAYTVGKIYEFKDGAITLDNGTDYPANGSEVTSIDDWNSRYLHTALAKFLEIKE